MGIFGNSSPFDTDIEKVTSENNTSEEWGLIMEICDKVGNSSTNAKDCLRSILRRLAHPDPHVVVQAITLLDACVNNCGKVFHLEIASRDFETEFKKLLTKAQPQIAQKLRSLLKKWAEGEFKTDPQLNLIPSLLSKLKSEGMEFSDASDKASKKKETVKGISTAQLKEEEDLAKAIALSLQETKQTSPRNSSSGGTSKSLYPSMNISQSAPTASAAEQKVLKVRALYDFEAAEDNELTFMTGEIIHVTDSSDPNWWKGYNKRGEGLFPANFVTSDLSQPETQAESKKSVQFSDTVSVAVAEDSPVEIDEAKMDRLLSLLHDANPEDASGDTEEMLRLENEVYRMGPRIDQELEKADRQHAQLTQLSADLVDALNLYHSLMREPAAGVAKLPFAQPAHFAQPQMFNGTTTFTSLPSMNPYFSHIQQPAPVSMMSMNNPGSSMPAMSMPGQGIGPQGMIGQGMASLGMPGQPMPGPVMPAPNMQMIQPPTSMPQPLQTSGPQSLPQHYSQPSFVPTSGGQPIPPANHGFAV